MHVWVFYDSNTLAECVRVSARQTMRAVGRHRGPTACTFGLQFFAVDQPSVIALPGLTGLQQGCWAGQQQQQQDPQGSESCR